LSGLRDALGLVSDDFFLLADADDEQSSSNAAPAHGGAARPDMDLAAWFPLIEAAGVPVPRTRIVSTDIELVNLLDGIEVPGWEEFVAEVRDAASEMGFPCFLRTGHGSGKHQWKDTCFLKRPEHVAAQVAMLVDWSFTMDFFGLPTSTWVLREMLAVEAPFTAFKGMPVAKERRYFVDDGAVTGHHPYWPPGAVAEGSPRTVGGARLEPVQWKALLEPLNEETPDEVAELTALSEQVAAVVPGAWSVDWLWSPGRGWVCIDMAHAERSFVWSEYPTAPLVEANRP
jgi:hypothetical protein